MDMRNMRGMDGRRLPPRNARGEFRRRRRGDRGMDYEMDMARGGRGSRANRGRSDYGDMNYTGGRGGYPMRDYGDMRGDYNYDMARQNYDGHYPQGQGSTYYPIEAMGVFNGYYGMPEQDYGMGGRRDYGYDMRYDMRGGRRDYGYDDFGYEYGDFGTTLSEKELEEWCKKMKSQLSEQEKQMFSKEAVMQRAKALNRPMEGFGEKELYTATLMWYTDNKEFFGQNIDFAVKGGYAFLADKDVKVKGAEKLAVYYDEIVMGGEYD